MRISDWSSDVCSSDLLSTDLLEKGIVSGPFDVDACLPVGIETALGKIGAADNRLGLSARLEIENLGMEATWTVLGNEGVRNVNKALDEDGIGRGEVNTYKDEKIRKAHV